MSSVSPSKSLPHFKNRKPPIPPAKAIARPCPKLSKDPPSLNSSQNSFNIWDSEPPPILQNPDFLQLYRQRYIAFTVPRAEKGLNLEIMKNVYKLCGEQSFRLSNWKGFILESDFQKKPRRKEGQKPLKLSVFGLMNAIKSDKPPLKAQFPKPPLKIPPST